GRRPDSPGARARGSAEERPRARDAVTALCPGPGAPAAHSRTLVEAVACTRSLRRPRGGLRGGGGPHLPDGPRPPGLGPRPAPGERPHRAVPDPGQAGPALTPRLGRAWDAGSALLDPLGR